MQLSGLDAIAGFSISGIDANILHEAESAVLISSILNPNTAFALMDVVKPEYFQTREFQSLWLFICTKIADGKVEDINLTTVQLESMRLGHDLDLTSLLDFHIEDADILMSLGRKLKELFLQEKLRDTVTRLHSQSQDLPTTLLNLREAVTSIENEFSSISTAATLSDLHDEIIEYLNSDEVPKVYSMGLPNVDVNIVDFAPGNTIIIGGTPATGKTSYGIFTALENARQGIPVHFFSLEMSQRQIAARFINCLTGISATKILTKSLAPSEKKTVIDASKLLKDIPLRVTTYADMPLTALLQSMRDSKLHQQTEIFYVDYVQLINFIGRTKREEASFVAQQMKSYALSLDAAIVLMSQLSRNNKVEPDMQDLKETSDLEQSASLVVLLYHDKLGITDTMKTQNAKPIFFKVDKQRNGPVFKALTLFNPSLMRFQSVDYNVDEYEKKRLEMSQKRGSKPSDDN